MDEDKVDIKITRISLDMLLAVNECKTSPQFQNKLLQVVYQSLLQLRLCTNSYTFPKSGNRI